MRAPAVAGRFYPKNKNELKKQIEKYLANVKENRKQIAEATISPHAGYIYSGKTATKSIASLKKTKNYIIIGPSHQGTGTGVSLSDETWKTPLGEIDTNKDIIDDLKGIGLVENRAHEPEHSIEVQLPILQTLHQEFKIVPIMMSFQDKKTIKELSNKLTEIIEKKDAAIIVSSDFTHYETKETASKQDKEAIESIKELDLNKFLELINKKNYSICGYGPIGTVISIAKNKKLVPELLDYRTSAEATGDTSQVVGYASISFKEIK